LVVGFLLSGFTPRPLLGCLPRNLSVGRGLPAVLMSHWNSPLESPEAFSSLGVVGKARRAGSRVFVFLFRGSHFFLGCCHFLVDFFISFRVLLRFCGFWVFFFGVGWVGFRFWWFGVFWCVFVFCVCLFFFFFFFLLTMLFGQCYVFFFFFLFLTAAPTRVYFFPSLFFTTSPRGGVC